jgi:nitrite reductase/ring-hydroxylating ferredoxin subunit/DMSO/TMAO reductase YedYZ heme-binding membrane subunit
MSVSYQAVGWNRQKRVYNLTLATGIVVYLGAFIGASSALRPEATIETLLIRGFGTAALLLLHIILSIGPLARLDRRFLPLLYNRRHLGVAMFILALAHGGFSILQFHAFGALNPLASVLASNGRYDTLSQFPFQTLGLAALGILFLMAATSHDFWLVNLTAPVWKTLHMLVYLAYGLVILHVALGVLQKEASPVLAVLLGLGALWILGLHTLVGWREAAVDRERHGAAREGYVELCAVDEISDQRAKIFPLSGERVAVFRYDGKISAISNVCKHQNGPLGEGKIINGCVVCPWHGYQYRPEDGTSPPPFAEKVPTFRVRVIDGKVWADPRPLPPGTRVEPAEIDGSGDV